jgi:hypothetical protein
MKQGYGLNPYDNSVVHLKTWLQSKKNFIVLYDEDFPLCFKREYLSDLFAQYNGKSLSCKKEPKKTAVEKLDTKEFLDISTIKMSKDHIFARFNNLKKMFGKKSSPEQVFRIKSGPDTRIAYWDIVNNIKDISDALKKYSYLWDYGINTILRKGEDSIYNMDMFDYQKMNRYRFPFDPYPISRIGALKNIKTVIASIDKAFLETELGYENVIGYRGMKNHFDELLGSDNKMKPIGTSFVSKPYTSVSTSYLVAKSFMNKTTNCCFYKFIIDKKIPYINMINTTKFKNEKEILLPRNLLFRYGGSEPFKNGITMHIMFVTLIDESSLQNRKTPNKCFIRETVEFVPVESEAIIKRALDDNGADEDVAPTPKCPINTERNKNSGLCVPTEEVLESGSTPKKVSTPVLNPNSQPELKTKKCPKGTRKNKKTGLCEPKITKIANPKSVSPSPSLPQTSQRAPSDLVQPTCPPGMKLKKDSCVCVQNTPILKANTTVKKSKNPKCPKGTRRNKKTGLCEPIKK